MSTRRTGVRLRRRMAGVAYFAVIVTFLATQVAIYQKAFIPVVHVSLRTDHVGNQLQPPSDVKVRGLIVGEVRNIRATSSGAEMDLALQPDKARMIPRDSSARLLPKTLFGERYVSLVLPDRTSGPKLADGDVISQDRTRTSIEIERVLGNVMPLLQAVEPEKLSMTLNSVSMSLDGRGEELGDTLVRLNDYLKQLNPSLPDMTHDLRALGDVSHTYSEAAPEIAQSLRDLTTTTRTVVEQRQNLDHLYSTLTTTSHDAERFVGANKDNLVALNEASRPTLEMLARYSPEYPCLVGSLADLAPRVDQIFGKGNVNPNVARFQIEVVQGVGKYVPGRDDPRYGDQRGPRCYGPAKPGQTFRPPEGFPQDGVAGGSSAGNQQWGRLLVGPLVRGEVPTR